MQLDYREHKTQVPLAGYRAAGNTVIIVVLPRKDHDIGKNHLIPLIYDASLPRHCAVGFILGQGERKMRSEAQITLS